MPTDPFQPRIEIPEEILTFFQQHGRYIHNGARAAISYEGIVGADAEEVPPENLRDENWVKNTEEYGFENKDAKNRHDADSMTIEALRFLFDSGRYTDIRKAYMVNTGTVPIRVKFKRDSRKTRQVMYAKQPDTNRIVGRFFYDVLSGMPMERWGFNEQVFLEEGIPATPLSKSAPESLLLQSHAYQEGLIRASVYVDLLKMASDIDNPRNRLVDSEKRTILFDFDQIFSDEGKKGSHALLVPYLESGSLQGEWILDVLAREQHEILHRVLRSEREFFKFVGIAGQLKDLVGRPLDKRVRAWGARSLEDYFEQKFDEYRMM